MYTLQEMVYNIERHVKKYGPITQETMPRILFMRVVFTHGKHNFIIKTYVEKLKDNREYIKEMQSWGEMQKVADRFVELVIENDETYGEDERKKRAATLVTAQNLKPQIQVGDGAMRGGGRGRGRGVGLGHGQVDLFNSMFAQKPMQLTDWTKAGEC